MADTTTLDEKIRAKASKDFRDELREGQLHITRPIHQKYGYATYGLMVKVADLANANGYAQFDDLFKVMLDTLHQMLKVRVEQEAVDAFMKDFDRLKDQMATLEEQVITIVEPRS